MRMRNLVLQRPHADPLPSQFSISLDPTCNAVADPLAALLPKSVIELWPPGVHLYGLRP